MIEKEQKNGRSLPSVETGKVLKKHRFSQSISVISQFSQVPKSTHQEIHQVKLK